MYEYTIEQQIQDIREVSARAAKSKESALKFLMDAGILKAEDVENLSEETPAVLKSNK